MPRSRARKQRYTGRAIVRRRRANWRALARVLIVMLVIGGLGTGAYFALTSPRLIVSRVKVAGANDALAARLTRSLKPLCVGRNIFLINKKKVTTFSRREPEVARADVHRRFPQTVVVKIKERTPYAVARVDGASYLVDAAGLPFRRCPNLSALDLPVIQTTRPVPIELGRPCRGDIKSALQCISKAAALGLKISKISVDPAGDLCLNVVSGFYVRMGAPVRIATKLSVLSKMLDGDPELFKRIEYVDLSCPKAPAIRWKATAAK